MANKGIEFCPADFRHHLSLTPSRNEMAGKFERTSRKKGNNFFGDGLGPGKDDMITHFPNLDKYVTR